LNFPNSRIIIAPGGNLQVSNSINISGNSAFIQNYGQVQIGSNLQLNAGGSAFWNIGPSATLHVTHNIIINGNTTFINEGTNVTAHSLTLNGASSSLCLRSGACFSLTNLTTNGGSNVITADGQPAAFSYTGHATLNGPFTNSNQVRVCQAPGATVNNPPGNWGAAQVTTNCTSGCGVLPYQELVVKAEVNGSNLHVRWTCTQCGPLAAYELTAISSAGQIQPIGYANTPEYSIPTANLTALQGYIQVKGLNQEGAIVAQGTAAYQLSSKSLRVYPTLVENEVQISYAGGPARVFIYNAMGQLVETGEANQTLYLGHLPKGPYWVVGEIPGERISSIRIVRL
jgi:hypothetical protein